MAVVSGHRGALHFAAGPFGDEEQAVSLRELGGDRGLGPIARRIVREAHLPQRLHGGEVLGPVGPNAHGKRCATSHSLIAPARPGAVGAAIRSASIRATSALSGTPSRSAACLSRSQNSGSRLTEVLCPAISTERLTGGW